MSSELELQRSESVLQVLLKGAGPRGEIQDATVRSLTTLLRELPDGIHTVLLSGGGANFCGGRAAGPPASVPAGQDVRDYLKAHAAAPILDLYDAIHDCKALVACFVQGVASGLGCAIVAASDHAVAAHDAQFEAPELDKHFAPGLAMSAMRRRLHAKAMARLVLTMQPIDAQTALAVGLVGEVVAPERLEAAAQAFAALMSSRSPQALAGIKRMLAGMEPLSRQDSRALAAQVTADTVALRLAPFTGAVPAAGRMITVKGGKVGYDDTGEGYPLLLLHSLGTSRRLWDGIAPHLAPHLRLIAMDARAHGASRVDGGYVPQGIEDDVVALADHLGLERFALLGISMGGLTAARVAARLGRRVSALVLASTYARVPADTAAQRLARVEGLLGSVSMDVFGRLYADQTLAQATAYWCREAVARDIASMSRPDYLQTLRAIVSDDVYPRLGRIEAPALVLSAEHDQSVPLAMSLELAQHIGGAQHQQVQGAAHLACLDKPGAFADAVLRFVTHAIST